MDKALVSLSVIALVAGRAEAAPSPAERARAVVTAQLAALTDSDEAGLGATFAPDAVVLWPRAEPTVAKSGLDALDEDLVGGSPHLDITKGTIKKLSVGGTADAIVIVAELALTYDGAEPGFGRVKGTSVIHAVELLVDTGGGAWKVVAASFEPVETTDWGSSDEPGGIPGASSAGPLTPMLAAPTTLAAALDPGAATTVFGTGKGERAIGPAKAKKLLAGWRKLELAIIGAPREVRTATYGFAQATVRYKRKKGDPIYFRALLVAVPAADGAWRVVAAQYVSP